VSGLAFTLAVKYRIRCSSSESAGDRVSASKNRLRWSELPAPVHDRIAALAGGRVIAAGNCAGGFSPGLAARLLLDSGRCAFAKAIDGREWPSQRPFYTAEAMLSAALPAAVPAPRLRGSHDDGRWLILVFDYVPGTEPARPWRPAELERVVVAAAQVARHGSGLARLLPADHPRLGGWADIAADGTRRASLAALAPWAAAVLDELIALESAGLAAARGDALVHFDMYAHNILLTSDQVVFVDWPWARRGAPFVDLVMLLASAAADGIDPEPYLATAPATAAANPAELTGVLAAHAGFCLAGALLPAEPGLEPIYAAKLELGTAALRWLRRRIA
jgi:hypothetical protein